MYVDWSTDFILLHLFYIYRTIIPNNEGLIKKRVCSTVLGLATAVMVQTHTLLDLSISSQLSSTIQSGLTNRQSKKSVSRGRRGNIWLPHSTYRGYLALHQLPETDTLLPKSAWGKVDGWNMSVERAKGRHRPHKSVIWKGSHGKHLAEHLLKARHSLLYWSWRDESKYF